jgi:ParB family chromosome partitioning protein
MRFWWQLVMSYQEVSMDELSLNVGKPKLDVIEALISVTPELKQALEDKTLPVKVARIVGQLPEQQQQSAAEEALAQRPSRRQSQHPSAGAPESQSERAMASSVQRTDEDLAALAADLKRRLTSQQIEELVELLID